MVEVNNFERKKSVLVHTDCRFFRGNIPCSFHKSEGVECNVCNHYKKIDQRIIIIKLGAIGDVIRTTPLLLPLRKDYPNAEITLVTHSPQFIPKNYVDNVIEFQFENILPLIAEPYDLLINLDKDKEACALSHLISAKTKKGFTLRNGRCVPIDRDTEHKWLTGLSDRLNRENTKSYLEEIFEICGYKFSGEEYILPTELLKKKNYLMTRNKKVVGLNTGCGERWKTRLWPTGYWIELAKKLLKCGMEVLILGGPQEHEKNIVISEESGATYLGTFPIDEFVSIVNQCDLVVTQVTFCLHVAIALKKKIVLMNNIFNKNEFELYGLGTIVEPDVDCKGCFKNKCEKDCMSMIYTDTISTKINELLA